MLYLQIVTEKPLWGVSIKVIFFLISIFSFIPSFKLLQGGEKATLLDFPIPTVTWKGGGGGVWDTLMNQPADAGNADPKPAGAVENGDTAEIVVARVN